MSLGHVLCAHCNIISKKIVLIHCPKGQHMQKNTFSSQQQVQVAIIGPWEESNHKRTLQTNEQKDILLGGKGSDAITDGAGMFIAMSLFHFSIFGNTSFSQFSIFGRISPVTAAAAADAVTVADDRSSPAALYVPPRGCFLSRRPFSRGGNLPLLPRFCSAWRALAYNQTSVG